MIFKKALKISGPFCYWAESYLKTSKHQVLEINILIRYFSTI